MAEMGNTKLVPLAEEMLTKLDTMIETTRLVWDRSPAGAFCCVPDVLAGLPTPMRRQVHQKDEHAPITIFAICSSSGGIGADILTKRGIAILAFVMALSRVRPVELYHLDIGGGRKDGSGETIVSARINTAPLDLATACYVLTSSGFTRRMVYGLEEKLNGDAGSWPKGYYSAPGGYNAKLKKMLVADPERCLIIDAARYNDDLIVKPIEWINKQIKHFTQNEDEDNG